MGKARAVLVLAALALGMSACGGAGSTDREEPNGPLSDAGDGGNQPLSDGGRPTDAGPDAATDGAIGICGDAARTGAEQCDDGNRESGDGCDDLCRIESGFSCAKPGEPCQPGCGDGMLLGAEICDDGNQIGDDYCANDCVTTGSCGDGMLQLGAGEGCDDGNTLTDVCAYGMLSCNVCDASCLPQVGATSYCNDGMVDADNGEDCEDGNTVTESCAYGLMSCMICDSECHMASGAVSYCGDNSTDSDNSEQCDEGSAPNANCAYGLMSCMVCTSACQDAQGATTYCGDTIIDATNNESCDDGNSDPFDACDNCMVVVTPQCGDGVIEPGVGEECDDGDQDSLDGCNGACRLEPGWTCPTPNQACVETCGDGMIVGAEVCDDQNSTDTDYCSNNCRIRRRCGDGSTQSSAGEQCDDGNTVTESCAYGMMSCTVCNSMCRNQAGATSYCGDATLDSSDGEECETAAVPANPECTSTCRFQRYCVLEYDATGNFQLTSATAGNGTWPQSGARATVRVRDNGAGAPADGPANILYYRAPINFTTNVPFVVTATANLVGTAGTVSNRCPLNSGTLAGNTLTWNPCAYGPDHCTVNWDPQDQTTFGAGCLSLHVTGNLNCNGIGCAGAGVAVGSTAVDDTYYQPVNTLQGSGTWTSFVMNGAGGPTDCPAADPSRSGSASYTNKLEVPDHYIARSWIDLNATRTTITCNQLAATGCP